MYEVLAHFVPENFTSTLIVCLLNVRGFDGSMVAIGLEIAYRYRAIDAS